MIALLADDQNRFHSLLTQYINSGYVDRRDLRRALLQPGLVRKKHAVSLVQQYRALRNSSRELSSLELCTYRIPLYAGQDRHVQRMMDYLAQHLKEDLCGAYAHGSLGSYEEITYSDFDALVILKDDVFRSPHRLARVARHLQQARSIMLDYDPLQHHGWFVLTESDLHCYCEAYFPSVLFRYAKALLPGKGEQVALAIRDSRHEIQQAFQRLSEAVIRKLKSRSYPRNVYELKSLLSQFMLLPALYLQARDGRGIWKADSFALAKPDFSADAWASMKKVSDIRQAWSYEVSGPRRWIMTQPGLWGGYLRKRISPPIPEHIASLLDEELYAGMVVLSRRMKQKLVEKNQAIVDFIP